jgi:type II secretory pathway pseudopilin PulG
MYQEYSKLRVKDKVNGYTLIEVFVSILFFAILALSLSHTFTNSLFLTQKEQDVVRANNAARHYLKQVGIEWRDETKFTNLTVPQVTELHTDNGRFFVDIQVETLETSSLSGTVQPILNRVSITYRYEDGGKKILDLYLDYPISVNLPG